MPRGFYNLRMDTARQYLRTWYARLIYHSMRKKDPAKRSSQCWFVALGFRRKLLSGDTEVRPIDEKMSATS